MMYCAKCGSPVPENGAFCPACGQAVAASADLPDSSAQFYVASLKDLKCPSCGSGNFALTGEKGALGKAVATGAAFGAIGNIVAGSKASKNLETYPMQYKCTDCNNKFVTGPLLAAPEDVLPIPCTVTFNRLSSFVGSAVPQIVYLNGMKIGAVKNGKSLTFETYGKFNVIFVTDSYGVAFKGDYKFVALPGGAVTVNFNRTFK